MIYFDNAATTWPKPESVINAVAESLKHSSANPGRSGHKMSISASEKIFSIREEIAAFFGISNPCNVIFTMNSTHALNIVINGVLEKGDHVICTQMDHNSVLRPIFTRQDEVEISVAKADSEGYVDSGEIKKLIKPNTKLIAVTHASNVCGTIEPAKQISKIAKEHGVLFLLDTSQSAGILNITDYELKPLICGGTGSSSHLLTQPQELPDRFEAGTLNYPGICGLGAGVRFVSALGCDNIFNHEKKLCSFAINGISELPAYKIIGKKNSEGRVGTISFVHETLSSQAVSEYLNSSYNIATRSMYHCAYPSHVALGTKNGGTVRVSFGIFNTISQVKTLLYALEHIQNK